jgi:anti-anti-sigma factor
MVTLKQCKQDGLTVVRLAGSMTSVNDIEAIEASFGEIACQPGARIVVDLAGVEMIGTPSVAMFVAAAGAARKHGGHIVFTQPNSRVDDMLQLLRLDSILKTVPRFDQAVSEAKAR